MRFRLTPGAAIESLTAEETRDVIRAEQKDDAHIRVRAEESKVTDATGAVNIDIYKVPMGFEFELRRFFIEADGVSDITAQQFAFAAGTAMWIARSERRIGYIGQTGGSARKLPTEGSYGDEQGPYLRNGEILQLWTVAGPASIAVQITAEGILRLPPDPELLRRARHSD